MRPEDVGIDSEIADLDRLRAHFRLEAVALLGHSWGGLLALEYALRHPEPVSQLILLNTAPAFHDDLLRFRQYRRTRAAADLEALAVRSSGPSYREGDPDAMAEYYRIYFRIALTTPEQLERVVGSLRASPTFTREGILRGRAIGTASTTRRDCRAPTTTTYSPSSVGSASRR